MARKVSLVFRIYDTVRDRYESAGAQNKTLWIMKNYPVAHINSLNKIFPERYVLHTFELTQVGGSE